MESPARMRVMQSVDCIFSRKLALGKLKTLNPMFFLISCAVRRRIETMVLGMCYSRGTALLTCTEQGVAAIQRIHCRDEDEDMGVSTGGDEDMGVSTSSPADSIVWSVADSGCVLCLRVDGSERYALFGGYVIYHFTIFSNSLSHVGPWRMEM